MPRYPPIYGPNIVENGPVVFPVGAFFNKLESYSGGKTWRPEMGSLSPSSKKGSVFRLSNQLEKVPKGTRNILKQPGSSTVASFGRENDLCEDA